MTTEIQFHETTTSLVMASPAELDAGSDVVLTVHVACTSGCKLNSQSIRIIDQNGALHQEFQVAFPEQPAPDQAMPTPETSETVANDTYDVVLKAPIKPGEYTWTIVFMEQELEGVTHQSSSAPFSFTVKPHRTSMTVWDVPTPVVFGSKFTVKAGVLCSAGCKLSGKTITVHDAQGAVVGTGTLSQEPWSHAGPLYWAEIELTAPSTRQVSDWTVKFSPPAGDETASDEIAHPDSEYAFAFATAPAPEHVVRLQVIDKAEQTPVPNADVAFFPAGGYPYRTRTDASGTATLQVAKGNYEIFVALMDYDNYKTAATVDADVTLQAEFVYHPDLGG